MFRPRVIPCLLLRNQGLVKTVKFQDPRYIGDPLNAVKIFNTKRADELIFLDIDASKQGRTISLDLVEKIADETFMPFAVGGGIRELAHIRDILSAGAEKVVINTHAVETPKLIRSAAEKFGSQSIIVAIDVKKKLFGTYEAYTHGGTKRSGISPEVLAQKMANCGAGEIFINSIDRDGTMSGFDLELVQRVADSVRIPVIACGGAGTLEDLVEATDKGNATAVAAGSLFIYHGRKRAVLINFPNKQELMDLFSPADISVVVA